jgi:hypothetical protein
MVQLKYMAALYRMVCCRENILYAFTKYGCHTVQPHVNNLDYNLGIIQLIIPNKQGLRLLVVTTDYTLVLYLCRGEGSTYGNGGKTVYILRTMGTENNGKRIHCSEQ